MKRLFLLYGVLSAIPLFSHAELYKCFDQKGEVIYTSKQTNDRCQKIEDTLSVYAPPPVNGAGYTNRKVVLQEEINKEDELVKDLEEKIDNQPKAFQPKELKDMGKELKQHHRNMKKLTQELNN